MRLAGRTIRFLSFSVFSCVVVCAPSWAQQDENDPPAALTQGRLLSELLPGRDAPSLAMVGMSALDADGRVVSTRDVEATTGAIAVADGPVETASPDNLPIDPGQAVFTASAEDGCVLFYDNTTVSGYWYQPGLLFEALDYGVSLADTTVCRLNFAYATKAADPGTITIRFYGGTTSTNCPGGLLAGFSFNGLEGSPDGQAYWFSYTIDLTPQEQFHLRIGAFGYSYGFSTFGTGIMLAGGGSGNEDNLYLSCLPISFGGSPWAGSYMSLSGGDIVVDQCLTPPEYDFAITPTENWQVAPSQSLGTNGCRIYQMYLYAESGYDFSLCANDGVGGSCDGDGDLAIYDAAAAELLHIDAGASCGQDASTIGTTHEHWSCPYDGMYYLAVSDHAGSAMSYSLAYRTAGAVDIRINSSHLEFDCSGSEMLLCDSGDTPADAPVTAPLIEPASQQVAKLIRPERIMGDLATADARAPVIVTLAPDRQAPAMLRSKLQQSRTLLRRRVAERQDAVLAGLDHRRFTLRRRFENFPAFSCEVTAETLQRLIDSPDVIAIEPVEQLYAHLAQGIDLIDATAYRSAYTGRGVAIAICDTGIDYNHPDLGGGGFPNDKVIGGRDFGDNDPDPIPLGQAHGTSCAAIAAGDLGATDDYIGGVAPDAKLYALKISLGSTGSAYTDDIAASWDWAVTHQYDDPCNPILVISTSFGGGRYYSSCDGSQTALAAAASSAVAAGITVLASAGNDGWCDSMGSPACVSSVVSVGAVYDAAFGTYQPCVDAGSCATKFSTSGCSTGWYAIDQTAADLVCSYSNTVGFLDIFAPANRNYTADIAGPAGYSTGDYYDSFGGTSAACPYAAGLVASLQSASMELTGSYMSPNDVVTVLAATGDPVTDPKAQITKPRVNLRSTVENGLAAGNAFFAVHNDGTVSLGVDSVDTVGGSQWLSISPTGPFTVPADDSLRVSLGVDCASCQGSADLNERLLVSSSDPDSPYSDGVYINVSCSCCSSAGDVDHDCIVGIRDFGRLAANWLSSDCGVLDSWCAETDLDESTAVDPDDLALFAGNWLDDRTEQCSQ